MIELIYTSTQIKVSNAYQRNVRIKKLKRPKELLDYSQTTNDVYKNLKDHNQTKKRKVVTVFDDMIAYLETNKNLSLIVTESFLRLKKINISLVFIFQSYFKVPKTVRLNFIRCFIMNIMFDIGFIGFMKLSKDYAKDLFSFLVNDITLPSD